MADVKEPTLEYAINNMMVECKTIIASNEPEAQKLLGKTLMFLGALSAASKRLKKVATK